MSKIFFDKIPVIKVNNNIDFEFAVLVNDIQKDYTKEKAIYIDNIIFDLYKLSDREREEIGYIEIR